MFNRLSRPAFLVTRTPPPNVEEVEHDDADELLGSANDAETEVRPRTPARTSHTVRASRARARSAERTLQFTHPGLQSLDDDDDDDGGGDFSSTKTKAKQMYPGHFAMVVLEQAALLPNPDYPHSSSQPTLTVEEMYEHSRRSEFVDGGRDQRWRNVPVDVLEREADQAWTRLNAHDHQGILQRTNSETDSTAFAAQFKNKDRLTRVDGLKMLKRLETLDWEGITTYANALDDDLERGLATLSTRDLGQYRDTITELSSLNLVDLSRKPKANRRVTRALYPDNPKLEKHISTALARPGGPTEKDAKDLMWKVAAMANGHGGGSELDATALVQMAGEKRILRVLDELPTSDAEYYAMPLATLLNKFKDQSSPSFKRLDRMIHPEERRFADMAESLQYQPDAFLTEVRKANEAGDIDAATLSRQLSDSALTSLLSDPRLISADNREVASRIAASAHHQGRLPKLMKRIRPDVEKMAASHAGSGSLDAASAVRIFEDFARLHEQSIGFDADTAVYGLGVDRTLDMLSKVPTSALKANRKLVRDLLGTVPDADETYLAVAKRAYPDIAAMAKRHRAALGGEVRGTQATTAMAELARAHDSAGFDDRAYLEFLGPRARRNLIAALPVDKVETYKASLQRLFETGSERYYPHDDKVILERRARAGSMQRVLTDQIIEPKSYADNPLIVDGITHDDVRQGLADCYFAAPLANIAYHHPNYIRRMIRKQKDDTYLVRLFDDDNVGKASWIRVDADFPVEKIDPETTVEGSSLADRYWFEHMYSNDGKRATREIWPAVVEKAAAQEFEDNDYEKLAWGSTRTSFRWLLGHDGHLLPLKNADPTGVARTVSNAVRRKDVVVVSNGTHVMSVYGVRKDGDQTWFKVYDQARRTEKEIALPELMRDFRDVRYGALPD